MFWLGLATTVAYVPGWTGASIPTGWAVLSCVLPLALWREIRLSSLHWAILLFAAYAAAAVLWSVSTFNVWGLWQVAIFLLAIWLGTSDISLRQLFRGCAIGVSASSALAVGQWAGWDAVMTFSPVPAGLFYNSAIFGLISAMIIVALVIARDWVFIPALIPGMCLANSRGAWLILAVGLVACWRRSLWLIAIAALLFLAVAMQYNPSSNSERLLIWKFTAAHLTWFGNGPGSFLNMWYTRGGNLVHPEYSHNEFLQFAFEYGIGAVPLLASLALLSLATSATYWPVYVCCIISALFVFPTHVPATALVMGVSAGHCSRNWNLAWRFSGGRRLHLLSRLHSPRSISPEPRS